MAKKQLLQLMKINDMSLILCLDSMPFLDLFSTVLFGKEGFYFCRAVVAQWIRPWTLNREVPGLNLPAAAVVPFGKAFYPLCLVPRERT